jgi:hypothetical protein
LRTKPERTRRSDGLFRPQPISPTWAVCIILGAVTELVKIFLRGADILDMAALTLDRNPPHEPDPGYLYPSGSIGEHYTDFRFAPIALERATFR